MDDLVPMARTHRRAERIEPALRRKSSKRGDLNIGLTKRDRPSAKRSGTGRSGGGRPGPKRGTTSRRRANGRATSARRNKRQKRGFFRRALRITVITLIVLLVSGGAVIAYFAAQLPNATSWAVPERPPNIKILAADGSLLANRGDTGGENVTLEELPPYLHQAVVAIEDRRFYSHIGIDPIGLGRVLVEAITSGDRLTGASTITQQLARTLFLTMDRTAERKIQEAILAVWLEIQYSKDDILEMYLNRVYFGAGAYGVDAAARVYFGKPASSVTLAEAALLAGLLPAPSRYAPTSNPDAAKARQLLVLRAMVETGFITERQAGLAAAGDVVTVDNTASGSLNYVADWVADLVPSFIGAINGDIVVDTTIDTTLQSEAAATLGEGLAENGEALGVSQGALLAMSVDGAVRAMVGGRDYSESQFNRAVSAQRQPGSAFKPFVYLTALERGLYPETIRFDQPVNINGWAPENYSEEYLGPVSLQRALALSLNTVSVQLTSEVGPASVVSTARRLGIGSQIEPHPSIALGTSEVSLLEMTGAYATFANGGNGVIPYVIRRIQTEDGDILYERAGGGPGQVVRPEYVAMMNSMLAETMATGTGRRAAIGDWSTAGKTGTSQDWRDAWFVGFTSHLVTGIWIGNDDNSPTQRATGGNLPAAMWNRFMTVAHAGIPVASLPGDYYFSDPVAGGAAQNIDDIINQRGAVYNEYGNRYDPIPPPPGYQGPMDRYNPAYDPRLDPNYQPQPPTPVGQQQQPEQTERPGLLRRLFGGR